MLNDSEFRPLAKALLDSPILRFYQYLLYENEALFAGVVNDAAVLPALLSGLRLEDKNRAVISLLSLLNIYKFHPNETL